MSATSFALWRSQIFLLVQRGLGQDALALTLQPPAGLSSGERAMGAFWAACLYCQQGETATALAQLQAVDARGDWLAPARLADPDLAPLCDLPEFQALTASWRNRQQHEQTQTRPQLEVLPAVGQERGTLVALHMNLNSLEQTRPLFADLTEQGWRVALAQSGQLGGPDSYIWNDAAEADAQAHAWAQTLGGKPLWAGLSAGGLVALRGILTGKLAASGVLAVVPSLPNAPDWWPAMLPPLPVALVLGEQDSFTPNALWWAERLHAACVPVRVWTHSGGHEVPDHWPTVRAEALAWLAEAGA